MPQRLSWLLSPGDLSGAVVSRETLMAFVSNRLPELSGPSNSGSAGSPETNHQVERTFPPYRALSAPAPLLPYWIDETGLVPLGSTTCAFGLIIGGKSATR